MVETTAQPVLSERTLLEMEAGRRSNAQREADAQAARDAQARELLREPALPLPSTGDIWTAPGEPVNPPSGMYATATPPEPAKELTAEEARLTGLGAKESSFAPVTVAISPEPVVMPAFSAKRKGRAAAPAPVAPPDDVSALLDE
jgi:hypothetical protein